MAEKKNNGGPAFPLHGEMAVRPITDMRGNDMSSGMSLRDWFAGQALKGLLASADPECERYAAAASYSYAYADAMLAERSK